MTSVIGGPRVLIAYVVVIAGSVFLYAFWSTSPLVKLIELRRQHAASMHPTDGNNTLQPIEVGMELNVSVTADQLKSAQGWLFAVGTCRGCERTTALNVFHVFQNAGVAPIILASGADQSVNDFAKEIGLEVVVDSDSWALVCGQFCPRAIKISDGKVVEWVMTQPSLAELSKEVLKQ
jgi:hypothetical protein